MKKNIWKAAALFSAIVMAASALSGCGDDSNGTSSASDDYTAPELAATYPEFEKPHTIDITWFEQGWTGMEADKDIITPEIERLTGLKMNYEAMTVPTGDDYTQQLNLMIASNEVPDAFFGGIDTYTRTVYEKLGQAGTIWDFKDLIPDYEQLNELVYPEMNLYRTSDGKNYFVPTQTGRGYENLNEPPHGIYLRQDYLDELGMDYPSTPDELYEYLKRCKEELGSEGYLFGESLGGITNLYEMFFPLLGSHENYSLPFDSEDNYKVCNYEYTNSPELMEAAKFISKLSREGLLDKEALTIKTAQYQSKASSATHAAVAASWWDADTFNDNAKAIVPDEEYIYVCPPPIYASEEIKESRTRTWTDWVGCWSSLIINTSVDEETVRHLLAVMDYLTTQEGQMLVQVGIEGETYTWNDEGKYVFTDEFKEKTNDLDWNKAAAYGVFYYAQLVNNTPAITELQETPSALTRADNLKSWENQQITRDCYDKHMEPTKDYYFLPGEVELEKFPAIQDAKLEFWAKIISAQSDEEVEQLVNEWGETCKSMGIDEIVAERQAFIDNLVIE